MALSFFYPNIHIVYPVCPPKINTTTISNQSRTPLILLNITTSNIRTHKFWDKGNHHDDADKSYNRIIEGRSTEGVYRVGKNN